MNVLYLGPNSGTSKQRAKALERCGHCVRVLDPQQFVPGNRVVRKINWESGGFFSRRAVERGILSATSTDKPYGFVLVDGGQYVGPVLIDQLRQRFGPVVNYNHDDPYSMRDRFSWQLYLKSVPHYDAVAVVREENVAEAAQRGARKVVRVWRCADEAAHARRTLNDEDLARWRSDVVFVGTWMESRGRFMAQLLDLGVPLSIYGGRWERAREWGRLKAAWRGASLDNEDDYAKAIQCSKIALGLLSKGNRDLHTSRTMEIPALGAVFCAERTPEHLQTYADGEEAVFWSSAEECAAVCKSLLSDDARRLQIAASGHARNLRNGYFNQQLVTKIMSGVVTA